VEGRVLRRKGLREFLQKLLASFRPRGTGPLHGAKPRSSEQRSFALQESTGETIFEDRALRFRSLTLSEPDLPTLEDPDSVAGSFKIRLSKLRRGRLHAASLVAHRYEDRGYHLPHFRREPALYTFMAYDEGHLMGTVSVRIDSHRGLAAEELYPDEVESLRKQGYRICEFTRLAVDRSAASKPVLAGLFHTAYLYAARIRGCTHAVIEVTPQHSAFYHRALRFDRIGPERLNPRVNTTGVLMCVTFDAIADALATFAGHPEVPGALRSLFVYGFPPEEELGVLTRLRERLGP
jgi:hypothetical protein